MWDEVLLFQPSPFCQAVRHSLPTTAYLQINPTSIRQDKC